ncbi:uncharacterized protein LOC133797908 [Humulus lupulus]|uniref:uncharacterized protein LOC133797908 n=1 Tax=Humulus lupulus TaxID=3486 RepID=UPI002B415F34|nr:uncharacterized protein LOC133797908 [Humulus lupulus]
MASSLTFSLIQTLNSRTSPLPPGSPIPSATPHISTVSFALAKNAHRRFNFKIKHLTRTSSDGTGGPLEVAEESKFVPLNAEDPQFGPPALLLLGFEVDEIVKIQQLLKEMDGEFLQIILCTEDMIPRSLWEAINTKQANLKEVKIAKSLPRICFLSGLSGEEMIMFIDAFPEAGLEPAVFAALVPNSADKPLQELIDEIMGDHEMMTSKQ